MCILMARLVFAVAIVQTSSSAPQNSPSVLLERYAANADRIRSWRMTYEGNREVVNTSGPNGVHTTHYICDFYCDGMRVFRRQYRWDGVEGTDHSTPKDNAHYLSVLWDGSTLCNYAARVKHMQGIVVFDKNPKGDTVNVVRFQDMVSPLFGHYHNAFQRVDAILRHAKRISLYEDTESVQGVLCHVIEADTEYGHYVVWIDPEHGYNIARVRIRASHAEGHRFRGKPLQSPETECKFEVLQFERFDGVWVPMKGTWQASICSLSGSERLISKNTVVVKELTLDPDHKALGSFVRDDIAEGSVGVMRSHPQIERIWRNGDFVPRFNEQVVGLIDKMVATLLGDPQEDHPPTAVLPAETSEIIPSQDPNEGPDASSEAELPRLAKKESGDDSDEKRNELHPHCGLYCLYTMMTLTGRTLDFIDLVKPEYLGHREGSSLRELRRAALDHNFRAEIVTRLTTRGLRRCPYQAVLHVRSHPESTEYNHYEIFLGSEKGKAKLCNPPEAPKLVAFDDLAARWDGMGLFVSEGPLETGAIMAPDRQRWFLYGMIGILAVLVAHFGERIWLAVFGEVPRRWSLGLSVGQLAVLGLGALMSGGVYHFASDEGLLANGTATAALQKGHTPDFIPKISRKTVRKLLSTDTVFVDARLAGDYERGHLDGAISLPIDANDATWQEATATIPEQSNIVVYCQSASCKFAEKVALGLIEDGYSDISIFRGGWNEWVKANGKARVHVQEAEGDNGNRSDPS